LNLVRDKRTAILAVAVLVLGGLIAGFAATSPSNRTADDLLADMARDVARDYAGIKHLQPSDIAAQGRPTVLLDVRQPAEFAVSHLPGATRIDPGASIESVLSRLGDVRGKDVVLYCSVGVRSSKLAERVAAALKRAGARTVANLRGGIFRWHNEQRHLVGRGSRGNRTTDVVHPYDAYWARYVSRADKVRYTPAPAAGRDG